MAKEQLPYTIDEWSEDGRNLLVYHARAKHFEVAVAAFEAVARVEPEANLAMRLGAQVLRERKGEKRKL
jgi:hypothetical protein